MIFKITSCVVSPNVIRMIRSEMMTSTWHEALMGDKRNALRVPSINFKETDYLEYLGIDGRIILECILKDVKWNDMEWIYLAEDRDKWWALVNIVTKLWVP